MGRPIRVSQNTYISNDSVSLEAGRKHGSIRKSRAVFSELIVAIEAAAAQQLEDRAQREARSTSAAVSDKSYRLLWEDALQRELSLLREILDLKQRLAKLTGSNVIPLRPTSSLPVQEEVLTRCLPED